MATLPTAQSEARGLLKLVATGETTLAALRNEIGSATAYRKAVCWFLDREANRYKPIPEQLRAQVVELLGRGLSCPRIAKILRIGRGPAERLCRLTGASGRRQGRGRRFSTEQVEQICNAVKAGKSDKEIEQQFSLRYWGVLRFRKQTGNFQDRRCRHIPLEQIREAIRAVENGATWKNAAARIHLSRTTLRRKARKLGDSP